MYIHIYIYICIVLRWCGLGCFMRKVGFTMSRGDWYFLRAETCWDGVRLYLLGICAARSCAFPASIWRWHKSGTVSRNRNYERKCTKMKENERKQEKEIQRDAMRLCLWILYISFHCGVRRCHCGVSRATFLEMVSVAHDLASFCMVL
jgi:hypothetical protein